MSQELLITGLPLLAGWIWWVDRKVSAHEEVIKRMDKLAQIMLEDRLAQGQNRSHA